MTVTVIVIVIVKVELLPGQRQGLEDLLHQGLDGGAYLSHPLGVVQDP